MERWSFEDLSDDSLVDGFHSDIAGGCLNTARTLARMAEIARRRIYQQRGFPSMKAY